MNIYGVKGFVVNVAGMPNILTPIFTPTPTITTTTTPILTSLQSLSSQLYHQRRSDTHYSPGDNAI